MWLQTLCWGDQIGMVVCASPALNSYCPPGSCAEAAKGLLLHFPIKTLIVMCLCVCAWHAKHVKVREQLIGVSFLLSPLQLFIKLRL